MSRERELLITMRNALAAWVNGHTCDYSSITEIVKQADAILSQPEAEPRYTPHGTGTVPPGPVVQQPAPMAITLYSTEPAPQQTVCMNENCDKPKICATIGRCCAVKNQHVASLAAVAQHKGRTPEADSLQVRFNAAWSHMGPHDAADASAMSARHTDMAMAKVRELEIQRNELRAENERLIAKVAELDGWLSKRPCQFGRCVEYNKMEAQIAGMK